MGAYRQNKTQASGEDSSVGCDLSFPLRAHLPPARDMKEGNTPPHIHGVFQPPPGMSVSILDYEGKEA